MTDDIAASAIPNAAQIEAWSLRNGPRWAALQPRIDALFAPVTALLLEAMAPAPGERLLDIGCGCGDTVLALARAAGPTGDVLGVDVSAPMLEVARRRVGADGLAARLLQADAATHAWPHGAFDGATSRFGVMFFDDPVAAFAAIRAALVPGGRLVFACWRPFAENEWFRTTVEAILPFVPPPAPVDPDAPGPFGLAAHGRARAVLEAAGWSDVRTEPRDVALRLGRSGEAAATAAFVTEMVGFINRMLGEADAETRDAALAALAAHLEARAGPGGIVLGGAVWLVSARA